MYLKAGSSDHVKPKGLSIPIKSKSRLLRPPEKPSVFNEIFDFNAIKESLKKVDQDILEMLMSKNENSVP